MKNLNSLAIGLAVITFAVGWYLGGSNDALTITSSSVAKATAVAMSPISQRPLRAAVRLSCAPQKVPFILLTPETLFRLLLSWPHQEIPSK